MASSAGRTMRCHYDVLEVSRTADADELKKQYRKMALRWHPDKNRDNLEEAEHRIKEINAAYEVLNDPNERAWYDDHRDAILRGGDGTAGADGTESPTVNLWAYFRSSCFEGFDDDEKGFYAVYGRAFTEIMRVERESGVGEPAAMPAFGNSKTSDKDVESFYGRWSGFISKLSFGWADLYNPNEAVNRYQRRLIDKENRKARDMERRAYNEQVRNLVGYIKKRDKRVLKLELNRQKERERREKERLAALDEKKRLRREAREQWREHYEEDIAQQLAEAEASGERLFRLADEDAKATNEARAHAEAQDEIVVWHCDACSKDFKSEKQLRNHENSKKHKEALKKLQLRMQREEEMLQALLAQEEAENADAAESDAGESTDEEPGAAPKASEDAQASKNVADNGVDTANKDGGADSSNGDGSDDNDSDNSDSDSDSDADFGAFGKFVQESSDEEDDGEDEEGEGEEDEGEDDEKDKVDENNAKDAAEQEGEHISSEDGPNQQSEGVSPPEAPTAQPTKAHKSKAKKQNKSSGQSDSKTEHLCVVCNTYFTSRNKLFQHIKATNHAVAPDAVKSVMEDSDAVRGGRRKGKAKKGRR
ncbi:DnaJ-like subfamily C member 21 [Hondaea fermentalgiana]|uniref:DnaJ-like subfamily C member 21 n=1 Tax=Hondaea fermentalgiana TaxID=2315210 RepID=A0A2R5GC75_9STRA|nr:DnaJ-like subfamily C member 21 [Hondaea fermentalgiana]|eukprot:GBG27919.1 DnaJ-like subfamily C member 21 [Hondaea fermentalgiana]